MSHTLFLYIFAYFLVFFNQSYPNILYTKIPDINFEKALIDLGIDDIQDGQLLITNAEKVTELNLNKDKKLDKINNLQGIEAFTSLQILDCSNNNLSDLDVSKNSLLTILWCPENQLITLDVSNNIQLRTLWCYSNKLKKLIIGVNSNIIGINCSKNFISSLDVSKNTNLRSLFCHSNQISEIDLTNNTLLVDFSCNDNLLSHINISKNTKLQLFESKNNRCKTICVDIKQKTNNWNKDISTTYKICK